MKKSQKFFTVDNLKEKAKQAKALILTDYTGLNVEQINQLRAEIKKDGGEYEVVKNNLLKIATKETDLDLKEQKVDGATAALWVYSDDIKPLKTLNTFIKKNERPTVKFGFWGPDLLDETKFKELANLPGLEELRGKLVGFLKSPLFGLAYNLKFNLSKLVFILKAKGGEN
jgi:large subunit ribosomal protein L10